MKYFKENDKTPFVVVAFGICLFFYWTICHL